MLDLLAQLVLAETRLLKLSAQLLRQPDAARELKTKVELKVTPLQANQDEARPLFKINAQIICAGSHQIDDESKAVFSIDCLQQLSYRQIMGASLTFEEFKSAHMNLSRQIYPLLTQRIQPLLAELGLHQVRLPIDMLQVKTTASERPDQLH